MDVTVIQPNETKSENYFNMQLDFEGLQCADLSLSALVFDNTVVDGNFFGDYKKSCTQTGNHARY